MIEIKSISKQYDGETVLHDTNLLIRNRMIYGLFGLHEAGKSTLLRILAGTLTPTQGTVLINGYDIIRKPKEARRQIGYLPQEFPSADELTPYEYLAFVASAKGVKGELLHAQIKEALVLTRLTAVQERSLRNLSPAEKQRLGLAQALMGNPDILYLDEPTDGLSPKDAMEIHTLIRKLGQSKTVVIASHVYADLSLLCDRIIVLKDGRVIAEDTPETLEAREDLMLPQVLHIEQPQEDEESDEITIHEADYEDEEDN
ncbi:MAG: ABC transporter ATP-binding protein [Clostridia bacterium]|nr:ABC transporter ATP-binding protein [Clostridia bacterium]